MGGYDFQAVALDASSESAAFEGHYEGTLSRVETGYFETSEAIFERLS